MTTSATPRTRKTAPADGLSAASDIAWAAKMERLRARAMPEVKLLICDDPAIKDRLARARKAAEYAKRQFEALPAPEEGGNAEAHTSYARLHCRAEAELEEAEAAHREASIELRFRALPRAALRQLIKEHPPAEDSDDETDDTFSAALIAAASVDGMTESDAQYLLDTWSNADAAALMNAANAAQNQARTDLGKG